MLSNEAPGCDSIQQKRRHIICQAYKYIGHNKIDKVFIKSLQR